MSVYIGHSSGSKPSVAAEAAADIVEAELALGGTPAASRYYGTNASAVRGFYPLPTGPSGTTNLGITQDASTVTLSSSSGTGVVIPAATITLAGAMTAADRIKLTGIAAGATANAADSALRDRTTHTGSQAMGTITGLSSALAGKADLAGATFGNLACSDFFEIIDNSSSFRMQIGFDEALSNDHQIFLPNASGMLVLAGHQHVINDIQNSSALGKSLLALANPPATRFAAFNAAGTVTLLDEPNFRSAIGACAGDDARLSDARTPTSHTHPASAISDSTTVGRGLMTLANPGAIRYAQINADNSVSLLDAAAFLAAIGAGSGGSKTLADFGPLTNQAPNSNAATPDTRNGLAVLDFDDATTERAVWVGVIPEGAVLTGGFKVRLHWMATTATPSGLVKWCAEVERMTTDADDPSFDYVHTGSGVPNGTSGVPSMTEITVTGIDSLAAGDPFRLRISRDSADVVNDTMAQDAELFLVEVRAL
jgi:hypothetical protein